MSSDQTSTDLADAATGAVRALRGAVAGFEAGCLTGEDARRLAEVFAEGQRLCSAGMALCAIRVSDCSAWTSSGARSPEHWLAGISGTGVGTARALLDTADRLESQPDLADAFRAGHLSQVQATEISAAASAAGPTDPDAARRLVEQAKDSSLRRLQDECRRLASASRSPEADRSRLEALRRGRYLKTWTDPDGAGRLNGRLAPDDYARFLASLKPFENRVFESARKAGKREGFAAYAADALTAMATAAGTAGSATEGSEGAEGAAPAKVIAVIDHAALTRGHTEAGECCEIVGVGPVPVQVVHEMMKDAFLAAVVTDGVDIRSVVHLGRSATAMQRTALTVRDRGCVNCGSTQHLEIDHVDGWRKTQRTELDRLAFLCHHDHFLKTYRGWTLTGGPGDWSFKPPASPARTPGDSGGPEAGEATNRATQDAERASLHPIEARQAERRQLELEPPGSETGPPAPRPNACGADP
jgi:hypothetical protein